jgi:hypothetical protein
MEVAAIDRELRGLQSELESLQGHPDSERFLGLSLEDYKYSMNEAARQYGWVVSDAGRSWYSGSETYKLTKNITVTVVLFKDHAHILYDKKFHGVDTNYAMPVSMQNGLEDFMRRAPDLF